MMVIDLYRPKKGFSTMSRATTGATLLLLAVAFLGGCGGTEKQEASVPPKSYAMRGMVRQISEPDVEERQIWIHHEAIDDFVDIRGDTVPMDAMTMPFNLAESVDLTGVEPGDKVSFRLDVDWSAGVPARIGHLESLPVETQLSFEEKSTEEPAEHGDH
jgi:Cu/Ag efflux protein CusF